MSRKGSKKGAAVVKLVSLPAKERRQAMRTTEARSEQDTTIGVLFLAFELSNKNWKLGFSTGLGQLCRSAYVLQADKHTINLFYARPVPMEVKNRRLVKRKPTYFFSSADPFPSSRVPAASPPWPLTSRPTLRGK
jgi:hypothetical protein